MILHIFHDYILLQVPWVSQLNGENNRLSKNNTKKKERKPKRLAPLYIPHHSGCSWLTVLSQQVEAHGPSGRMRWNWKTWRLTAPRAITLRQQRQTCWTTLWRDWPPTPPTTSGSGPSRNLVWDPGPPSLLELHYNKVGFSRLVSSI